MPNKFKSHTQKQPVIALDNRFIENIKNGLVTRKAIAEVIRPIDERLAEQIEHGLITQARIVEEVLNLANKAPKMQSIDGRELNKPVNHHPLFSTVGADSDLAYYIGAKVGTNPQVTDTVKTEPLFSPKNNGALSQLVRALVSGDSKAILREREEVGTVLRAVSTLLGSIATLPNHKSEDKEQIALFCADLTTFCSDYIETAEEAQFNLEQALESTLKAQ